MSRFLDHLDQFKYTDSSSVSPAQSSSPKRKIDSSVRTGSTTSPLPRKKLKRTYAPPETYAHLNFLQDYLAPELSLVFCGINPGKMSAEIGHHFGNPNNHFWRCLHEGGFTKTLLKPKDDLSLPSEYSIGMTNLVDRPTSEQSELSEAEQLAAVPAFLNKIAQYRPKAVCFVGLGISKSVFKALKAYPLNASLKSKNGAKIGLQSYKLVYGNTETIFFSVPSTSGRVVKFTRADKVKYFNELHELVERLKSQRDFDSSDLIEIQIPRDHGPK